LLVIPAKAGIWFLLVIPVKAGIQLLLVIPAKAGIHGLHSRDSASRQSFVHLSGGRVTFL